MAAPSNAYSNDYLASNEGTTAGKILALMAKELSTYVSKANAKVVFKLDDIWELKDKNGNDVFVGMVLPNGANAKFHASTRKGKLRVNKDGVEYQVLNDAGLNTLPRSVEIPIGNVLTLFKNFIHCTVKATSAYYSPTTRFGINLYTSSTATTSLLSILAEPTHINQNTSRTSIVRQWELDLPNSVFVRLFATNEEGTTLVDVGTFNVTNKELLYTQADIYPRDSTNADARGELEEGDVTLYMERVTFNNIRLTRAQLEAMAVDARPFGIYPDKYQNDVNKLYYSWELTNDNLVGSKWVVDRNMPIDTSTSSSTSYRRYLYVESGIVKSIKFEEIITNYGIVTIAYYLDNRGSVAVSCTASVINTEHERSVTVNLFTRSGDIKETAGMQTWTFIIPIGSAIGNPSDPFSLLPLPTAHSTMYDAELVDKSSWIDDVLIEALEISNVS